MATTAVEPFGHAVRTANAWLDSVAHRLNTTDLRFAYRVLRAWLHGLRDVLPVEYGARFAAELPELFRGVYYEGWDSARSPGRCRPDEYVPRFAAEAGIPAGDVPAAAAAVTDALHRHLSTGLSPALANLPLPVHSLLTAAAPRPGTAPGPRTPAGTGQQSHGRRSGDHEERLARVEREVRALADAVTTITRALEHNPLAEPRNDRTAEAARRAHHILLSGSG